MENFQKIQFKLNFHCNTSQMNEEISLKTLESRLVFFNFEVPFQTVVHLIQLEVRDSELIKLELYQCSFITALQVRF